jgi:protein O-mannosyl-transferase
MAKRFKMEGAPADTGFAWLPGLILVIAVALTYAPAWRAGFIWDDAQHVTRPDLRSWAGLGHIWFHPGATQQYYPLIHSSFWVEHRLWGDEPFGYHLVNILLHAFSAYLLLRILRQLEVPGAWLAAGIFALHPVQVETVAWVSELKNVLSGVFYFGAALFYLGFDRTRKAEAYAGSLALFSLGLLSKSVIATLPVTLLVIFWWKRGTLSWKRDALPLFPFFVVGIFSGLFTAWVERHFVGAEGNNYGYTFIERGLIAGHAIWFYLSKLLWPTDLIFIYPRWTISGHIWWQYLFPAAVLLAAVMLIWLSRWWRGPLAGFLFFAATLFPALGFFNVYPFRYSFVADHFQYLACLGVIVPCAAGMTLAAHSAIPGKRWLRFSGGGALLLLLAMLSWQRAWVYDSAEDLWTDTLARNPGCMMAHYNLGNFLLRKEQWSEAAAHYQKALEIDPTLAEAHNNLGIALAQMGQGNEAVVQYNKALEIDPNYTQARINLDRARAKKGHLDDAVEQNEKALETKPHDAVAHYNLGVALDADGQSDAAIGQYRKALDINPGEVKANNSLGVALSKKGQVDAAIDQFKKILEIDPNDAEAHNNLGIALAQKGEVNAAIAQFQEAIRLKPDLAGAKDNLGKAEAMERQ